MDGKSGKAGVQPLHQITAFEGDPFGMVGHGMGAPAQVLGNAVSSAFDVDGGLDVTLADGGRVGEHFRLGLLEICRVPFGALGVPEHTCGAGGLLQFVPGHALPFVDGADDAVEGLGEVEQFGAFVAEGRRSVRRHGGHET